MIRFITKEDLESILRAQDDGWPGVELPIHYIIIEENEEDMQEAVSSPVKFTVQK